MLAHLLFEFALRSQNARVEERHHRNIDRRADDRDQADALHVGERDCLRKMSAEGEQRDKNRESRRYLQQDRDAVPDARAQIKEGEQRNGQQPREERRGESAVEEAAPQYREKKVLNRRER